MARSHPRLRARHRFARAHRWITATAAALALTSVTTTAAAALTPTATALTPTTAAPTPTGTTTATTPTPTRTTAPQTSAAGLTQVTGFGTNPGNLAMYTYAPGTLPPGAPLVVALHGCTQSASDYHAHSGWPELADRHGFAVVYPQTSGANNPNSCFTWYEPGDSTRGRGEALSVRQMVDAAVARYGSDARRIYVTGLSAGGAMTANLLAAYPDVFAGGAVHSGLPAHCATSLPAAHTCMYSPPDRTPDQWGDLVRSAAPAGTAAWPRVAIWQGTADTTVRPANAAELRDQWTDVWGIGQTPSRTETLGGTTTRSVYDDASGRPAVEVYSVSGMGHGLAVDPGDGPDRCGSTGTYYLAALCSAHHSVRFWGIGGQDTGTLPAPTGLTVTGTTDTTVALRWDPVPGAVAYEVRRDGTKAGGTTSASYTDTGLATGTAYRYTVAAVDAAGAAGAVSSAVTATTTGFTPTCHTASNYGHTVAGRAYHSGGQTYARGSGQAMGLWNTSVTHTLRQSAPGHYVIADSGCPV
ncbi:extracellular catalytic domain type 1 short-chain-length polyhydroxyalkanoate depolymerase [Streptomyces sp. enrichment culture]|uniref:extracellular catalytic domain type 1 short-chain-length polyhydroxyalkanoate depolymerase n=1 Tax=Streptomyces sp. enrichment culture TaxID=1795815 RepID=UPI003F57A1A1